jgi:5-methylcytosine-specific restriction endonuclease McrA
VTRSFDIQQVHALAAQQPTTGGLDTDFVVELFRSVVGAFSSSPWVVGIFALVALNATVKSVRAVVHGRHSPDPQRRFSGVQRAEIFARAGNRCEHHSWLLGRCRELEGLQADHVHPHSRGGATAIANGQALCRSHNKRKAARVPWAWELARLARRREVYFPAGTSRVVVRNRPPLRTD